MSKEEFITAMNEDISFLREVLVSSTEHFENRGKNLQKKGFDRLYYGWIKSIIKWQVIIWLLWDKADSQLKKIESKQ